MELRSNKHHFAVHYELKNLITETVFTARYGLSVLNTILVNFVFWSVMKVHKTELSKKKGPPYRWKAHRSLSNEKSVKSNLKHLAPAGTRSSIIILSLHTCLSFCVAQQTNSGLGHPLLRFRNYTHTRLDPSERLIGPSPRSLPTQRTTNTTEEHPCHRRDLNLRSQQLRGRRPTP